MNPNDKRNNIHCEEEYSRWNDNGWTIYLGAWRTDEFERLLSKIDDHDFEQITLGEFWLVKDLLNSINQRG